MGFRHAGHACSFTAIVAPSDRSGARHDAGLIVGTGNLSTSGGCHILAYVRASVAQYVVAPQEDTSKSRLVAVIRHLVSLEESGSDLGIGRRDLERIEVLVGVGDDL